MAQKYLDQPLFEKMRALADAGNSRALELRIKAEEFEVAAKAVLRQSPDNSQEECEKLLEKLMTAWGQARRCYRDATTRDPSIPLNWPT